MRDEGQEPPPLRRRGRSPVAGRSQSLLLTVLGELVIPDDGPVWTASLLYVLAGVGFSEQAARQSIARAADKGWIVKERVGRDVRWSVTPTVTDLIGTITQRVMSLNFPVERWDGNGIFLNVVIPQDKSALRKRLYNALGWAGFGHPAPGLWTNPHIDRLAEAKAIITELGLQDSTITAIARLTDAGLTTPEIVARAWNLRIVAARYATLLDTYENLCPEPGDELLFSYLTLVDEWRKFPAMDPQLPRDVMPDWIGRRAADTFVTLRTRWQPAMRERWAEIVHLAEPRHPRATSGPSDR